MNKKIWKRAGFTLIELLITMAIFAVVAGFIYAIFMSGRRAVSKYEQLAGLAQEARGGLEQMEMELRMAGVVRKGLNPLPCKLGETLKRTVFLEATPTTLEFEGDLDVDGRLERVRYEYNAATRILYRRELQDISGRDATPSGITCDAGLADKAEAPLVPVAFSIDSLEFKYYKADGTELTGGPFTIAAGNNDNTKDLAKIKVNISAKGIDQTGTANYRKASMEIIINNLGVTTGTSKEPPAQVTGFTAYDAHLCGSIKMRWNPVNNADLNGYRIYYKESALSEWTTVDVSKSHANQWQLFGLKTDGVTQYNLMIAAFDVYGNVGQTSDVVTVNALNDDRDPQTPSNVTLAPDNNAGSVTIGWTGTDTDIDGSTTDLVSGAPYKINYNIYYSTPTPPNLSGTFNIPEGTMNYIHTNVNRCVDYTYQIESIDKCERKSARSAAKTARVQSTEDPPVPADITPGGGGYIVANKTYRIYEGGTNATTPAFADTKLLYTFSTKSTVDCSVSGPTRYNDAEPSPITWAQSPANAGSGGSFTGHWDGATKSYYCFGGYTVDACGRQSDIKRVAYAVSACKDEKSPLNGSGGIAAPNMCLSAITARVCDADSIGTKECGTGGNYCKGITLFWYRTAYAQCNAYPCDVDANGYAVNCRSMATDYFPDEGIGGYILSRGTNLDPYNDLSPDPVTGPLTPFYFADSNKWESACSNQGLKDRCQFRYQIRPVDCVKNNGQPAEANPLGTYFRPGRFLPEDSTSYPTRLLGRNLNIVEFNFQNTAAADMLLTRANFDWNGANWSKTGYVARVDISTTPGTWTTIWQASGSDPKKPQNSLIELTDTNIAASGAIGVSDVITHAAMRVYFVDSNSKGLTLTSNNLGANPELYVILYYKNKSSTKDINSLESECKPENASTIKVPGSPWIDNTRQENPSLTSVTSYPAPGSGLRADSYLIDNTNDIPIKADIHPYRGTSYVPVAQCGVKLFYTAQEPTVTVAPTPVDGTGAENDLAPTNYTQVSMCNTAGAVACTSDSCTYRSSTSIPAQPGKRVFYYIIATDDKGNFGIGPDQPPEATGFVGYTYDTKYKYYYLWLSPVYNATAGDPDINKIYISQMWLTGVNNCTGTGPTDTKSAGSSVVYTLTQYDATGGISFTETFRGYTSASGCSGCFPCESGPGATGYSTHIFDPTKKITITGTGTKSDFTQKTCTWSNNGSGTVFSSGGDTTCK
jgi:prepilin-type N-terminal cleavage/methylation domain-containing protein